MSALVQFLFEANPREEAVHAKNHTMASRWTPKGQSIVDVAEIAIGGRDK